MPKQSGSQENDAGGEEQESGASWRSDQSSTIVLNRAETQGGAGGYAPAQERFERERIENQPPVLYRGKLTFITS